MRKHLTYADYYIFSLHTAIGRVLTSLPRRVHERFTLSLVSPLIQQFSAYKVMHDSQSVHICFCHRCPGRLCSNDLAAEQLLLEALELFFFCCDWRISRHEMASRCSPSCLLFTQKVEDQDANGPELIHERRHRTVQKGWLCAWYPGKGANARLSIKASTPTIQRLLKIAVCQRHQEKSSSRKSRPAIQYHRRLYYKLDVRPKNVDSASMKTTHS